MGRGDSEAGGGDFETGSGEFETRFGGFGSLSAPATHFPKHVRKHSNQGRFSVPVEGELVDAGQRGGSGDRLLGCFAVGGGQHLKEVRTGAKLPGELIE